MEKTQNRTYGEFGTRLFDAYHVSKNPEGLTAGELDGHLQVARETNYGLFANINTLGQILMHTPDNRNAWDESTLSDFGSLLASLGNVGCLIDGICVDLEHHINVLTGKRGGTR
ncbi:hypothetical protein [Acidithiobacillus thiooxidans]|uniref:Uncharacterized protein n=1 Tax=Acidithiobacillus thiooxidans ATCC 19377 TaxID=637390 RepID=A0A543PZD4_ACITH|nr:hypothetical protein [Acidithiobacillus thiooxidans]MDX5936456.1 hypothetical protein [Acidithiobacillus thiooxidans]TQN49443.1 hypothetical protein DLNHIDIE_03297 [Acidithiobacillus thiooxidans ATCC 19377]